MMKDLIKIVVSSLLLLVWHNPGERKSSFDAHDSSLGFQLNRVFVFSYALQTTCSWSFPYVVFFCCFVFPEQREMRVKIFVGYLLFQIYFIVPVFQKFSSWANIISSIVRIVLAVNVFFVTFTPSSLPARRPTALCKMYGGSMYGGKLEARNS